MSAKCSLFFVVVLLLLFFCFCFLLLFFVAEKLIVRLCLLRIRTRLEKVIVLRPWNVQAFVSDIHEKDLCFRQLFLHVFYYDCFIMIAVSFCLLVRSFVLAFYFVFDFFFFFFFFFWGGGGGGGSLLCLTLLSCLYFLMILIGILCFLKTKLKTISKHKHWLHFQR